MKEKVKPEKLTGSAGAEKRRRKCPRNILHLYGTDVLSLKCFSYAHLCVCVRAHAHACARGSSSEYM